MLVYNMRSFTLPVLLFLLSWLPGCIAGSSVAAQPIVNLQPSAANVNAITHTEYYEDKSGSLSFPDIQKGEVKAQFKPGNRHLLSYGLTKSAIWLHGRAANIEEKYFFLLFEYTNIDSITLYYFDKGKLHVAHAGSHFPHRLNALNLPAYSFRIPADTAGSMSKEFWVRVRSSNSLIIPATLSTSEGLWHSYIRLYASELMYAGIVLALLFYNLSLYVWIRDKSYLYYLGYLFTLGSFILLYLRGFRIFLGQGVADFIRTYGFSMVAISYMFGLHFAISFLQGSVLAPRLTRLLKIISHMMWIVVACNIAGWQTLVIHEEQLLSLLTPLLVIMLAAAVYKKKYKPAIYFLAAWSFLLCAIVYFAACVMGLLRVQSWTLHALTIGSAIEMILLSFALGFRYLLLKRETAALQQAAMEMMKEHNYRLEREVVLRTKELQQALVSLTASNKVKDKLLGIVSHDFKTPLNNLYWLLDHMIPGTTSPERISRLRLEVSVELKRISMTMDNILNWSLTQTNGLIPRPENLLLPVLFEQILVETALAARKKQIILEVQVADSIMVWADPAQLRLVLLNLMHNAVKFSNTGGKVVLSAVNTSLTFVEIAVSDSGIGMTKGEAEQLLNAQTVSSRQGTAKEAGTGMGILLCREFISANGGVLYLESREGAGTRFYFQLKAAK
ncbi:sensor histidine kinase [Filimonas effusa]|uniref:histidine kinase n=1 Tax=Filimonas effusa TaxID=2508721 RepID=A0A4V1MAQ6_9BACT|nr:sensor histidine kinase [Filimonas effusa]RXK86706.1 hypothetical protein ESB13_07845 [Filimonas effusa]